MKKTFLRILFLLILAAAGGGGYAYHLWTRTDELLRGKILAALAQHAPDTLIEVGRTRFDFEGRIHIYDVRLRLTPEGPPLVLLPETIIVVDRELLSEGKLQIIQVRLLAPQVRARRDAQGVWDWSRVPVPKMTLSGSAPEWFIERGNVIIELASVDGLPDSSVGFRNTELRLIPSGKRRYELHAQTMIDQAGRLDLNGEWDMNRWSWSAAGTVMQVPTSPDLLRLLTVVSPEFRHNLEEGVAKLAALTPGGGPVASAPPGSAPAAPPSAPTLGLSAILDLHFRVQHPEAQLPLEYKVLVKVANGTLQNPQLPIPLENLSGKIYCDNDQLIVRNVKASHGATAISIDGKLLREEQGPVGGFAIAVRDLALSPEVRQRLPENLRTVYDQVRPSGIVDLQVNLRTNDRSRWSGDCTLTAKGCSALYEKFEYPVEGINGTLIYRDGVCDIALQGIASRRPISLTARIDRGERQHSLYVVRVNDLPLDERFIAAAPTGMRTPLQALNIRGTGDIVYRLERHGGSEMPYVSRLAGRLKKCTMVASIFAYDVSELSGLVDWDGTDWSFRELKGKHESAELAGEGTYTHPQGRGVLDLTVTTKNADINGSLYSALPAAWRKVWEEFSPSGRLNSETRILWTPGESPRIRIDLELLKASFTLKAFPFSWEEADGKLSIADGEVLIHSLTAKHDETRLRTVGRGEFTSAGEWRVRLDEFYIDDLDPNRRFRRALPKGFRDVVENLDPRNGLISLAGMLELRGTGNPEDYITAAWDVETIYAGATVTAGIDVNKLYGSATMRGTWDGEHVLSSGRLDLDSLMIQGYQFTQVSGPIAITGDQLVIGSKDAVNPSNPGGGNLRVPAEDRITASAIEGLFTLDGIAVLDETTSYRVLITMNGAKLERYAAEYLAGTRNLQGIMNGWIELSGRGSSKQRLTGRGQLEISPAALYELPVILAIGKILNLLAPDKTAFRHALVIFDIAGEQYNLRQIDLVGDAMNLRGRGYIRFDGKLSLDFFSYLARQQFSIPVLSEVLGEATRAWVGVEVRGTMKEPIATVRPVPQLDDALKRFLGAFDTRPVAPPVAAPPRPPMR